MGSLSVLNQIIASRLLSNVASFNASEDPSDEIDDRSLYALYCLGLAASLRENQNSSTFNESIVPAAKEEHANLGRKSISQYQVLTFNAVSCRLIVRQNDVWFSSRPFLREFNNSFTFASRETHSREAFISIAKTWKHTQCLTVHNGCA